MKIAIMTFYESNVYGAVLQAAALRHYLVSLGHEADLIRYTPDGRVAVLPSGSFRSEFLSEAKLILKNNRNPIVTDSISAEGFDEFREKHLSLTGKCLTMSDLEKLNEEYDAFICGSGNIWSAATFDPHMFLDFVKDPGRMIAYAPSFLYEGGENDLTLRRIGELVKRFEHLSVREETGRRLMNDYYGIHTEEVADPVLLLTPEQWQELLGEDWEDFTEAVEEEPAKEAEAEEPAEEPEAEEQAKAEEVAEETETEEQFEAEEPAEEPEAAEPADEPVTEEAFAEAPVTLTETPEEPGEEAAEEPAEETETEEQAEAEAWEPAEAAMAEEPADEPVAEESAEAAEAEETVEEAAVEETVEEEAPEEIPDEQEIVSVPEEAEKGYLLSYFLSDQGSFRSSARNLADRQKLNIKQIPFRESDLSQEGAITDAIDPARLVNLVRGARYVCTDCYHVALLAIVFHKELCCFSRFKKGEYVGMNARMVHILDAVGLLGRLYDDNTPIEQYLEKTDYIPVQYKLNALRLKSGEFLTDSLEAVENYCRCSRRNIPHVREIYSLCSGCGACAGVCPSGAVSIRQTPAGFLEAVVDENICRRCGECIKVCPMREEAVGVSLKEAQTLSYSDEDDALRDPSDGGALSYRLSRIFYEKGWAVAGCVFNEERRKAEHVLILPEGVEAPWLVKEEPSELVEDQANEEVQPVTEEETAGEENAPEAIAMDASGEEETAETSAVTDEETGEVPGEEPLESTGADEEEPHDEPDEVSVEDEEEAAEEAAGEPEEEQDPLQMLIKMQGAKLMQSDAGKIWEQIDMISCPVLFFGTPCQCAAARKRFPDREDITYVDVVCSGVPSANLMSRYVSSFKGKNNSGPCAVTFGSKNKNGESIIRISDGAKTRETVLARDPMARLLSTGACSGEFCYDCRWRERTAADIRMGKADASSLEKYDTDISMRRVADAKKPAALSRGTFGYGKDDVTAILCMNDKGKALLDQLMAEGYWEGLHKQDTATYLHALKKKNNPKPVYYKELMDSLADERVSFRKLMNEYVKPIEKRSKSIERMQIFTHAGRAVVNVGDNAGKKED